MGQTQASTHIVETAALDPGIIVKKGTGDKDVVKNAATTTQGLGITVGSEFNETFAVGTQVSVAFLGKTKIKLGATLTAGDNVSSDANGKAIATPTTAATQQYRAAVLLESGVLDELVDAVITNDFITIPA